MKVLCANNVFVHCRPYSSHNIHQLPVILYFKNVRKQYLFCLIQYCKFQLIIGQNLCLTIMLISTFSRGFCLQVRWTLITGALMCRQFKSTLRFNNGLNNIPTSPWMATSRQPVLMEEFEALKTRTNF